MTKDEALKLGLEALEADPLEMVADVDGHMVFLKDKAIIAIKEVLAQPKQEPGALEEKFSLLLWDYQELERAFEKVTGGKWIRKSNTPQRPWVDLSDEEIETLIHRFDGDPHTLLDEVNARLKDKNT